MNKEIDLDKIIDDVLQDAILPTRFLTKECMREAIHQALEVASENAVGLIVSQVKYDTHGQELYRTQEVLINKPSILSVEKFIKP